MSFIAMISHEFRSPILTISFATSLLKRHLNQWTEKKVQFYLEQIQTAAAHLSRSIDEVLVLGKAETVKLKPSPKKLDLKQFCAELVLQLQSEGCERSFINFQSFGNCKTVSLDEKFLHSIFTNLLTNAIKYSCNGSAIDFILDCQGQKVIFQIEDSGIGISATDLQHIFEPFYRGENVGDISGTGLGLAIVKKLVDAHNGRILVASEVEKGTKFTVELPLTK